MRNKSPLALVSDRSYTRLTESVAKLLETARRTSARAVNAIMTATYWEIGRRIVEFEQKGKRRAAYGEELLEHLSKDITAKFGRGFSVRNLRSFRAFYLHGKANRADIVCQIPDTVSEIRPPRSC